MSVHRKKDGRIAVVYYENGKQKWKYFGRGPDAELEAENFDAQVSTGRKIPRNPLPLFEDLVWAYFAGKSAESEKSTMKRQGNKFDAILLPEFGHLHINYLTPGRIDKFIAGRLLSGIKSTTIRREIDDMLAVLNWSMHRGLIIDHPLRQYRRPKRDDQIIQPPTSEEIKAILRHSVDHLRRAMLISFYTGLRPGEAELFSLEWSAVDFNRMIIRIVSAKKNGLAYRDIPMQTSFAAMLKTWHDMDKKEAAGKIMPPVVHYHGKRIKSLKTAWNAAKKRAGIMRRLRPYDLRHAFATYLLDKGADLKSVSEILGHKSIETTIRIYQHTSRELHRQTIDKLPDDIG